MKKITLKPTILRASMTILIFVILMVLIGGFYFAQDYLRDSIIGSEIAVSNQTSNNTSQINQPETDTTSQELAKDKMANMIASRDSYGNEIREDLSKYASDSGIVISDYKTTTAPEYILSSAQINGIELSYISVTLKNPVSYDNLLKFIKAIETNLPKLRLTGINITGMGKTGDSLNVEPLIIEAYIR